MRIDRTRTVKDVLWIALLAGVVAALFRLYYGLGATTQLSDAVPWGLWKILNMVAGVALSTSGFTAGFLVYVLKLKRFEPYMKPAILIAFLGYGCSCLALLFDIGLPLRFWHPILMWNFNSFLFEVFWCVLLYFTVTAIELAPTLLARRLGARLDAFLHRVATGVVIVGISLSTLHHSSLGSLFLVSPQRLHPLWYSPLLPVFFILSAMAGGIMVLVFASILYARWYDREPVFGSAPSAVIPTVSRNGIDTPSAPRVVLGPLFPALRSLAQWAAYMLTVYAALKIGDLLIHGAWSTLSVSSGETWLYALELIGGAVVPAILLALPRLRSSPTAVGVAAALGAGGLVLNRLNVGIFGYAHDAHTVYLPSLLEWVLSIAVVAGAGLVFLAVVEHFPVFAPARIRRSATVTLRSSLDTLRQIWNTVWADNLHRVSLLAVWVIPAAFVLMYPPYQTEPHARSHTVRPASGLNADRSVLLIDADRAGVYAVFDHADHQRRLGDSGSCVNCHHLSLPGDRSTACSRCHQSMIRTTALFEHSFHLQAIVHKEKLAGWHPANFSCDVCHVPDQPRTIQSAKVCTHCHRESMFLNGIPDSSVSLHRACSFQQAMHGSCAKCHGSQQGRASEREGLSECGTCHPSLRARGAEYPHVKREPPAPEVGVAVSGI